MCALRSELESMLELDCKAEIESLSHVSEDYLTGRYIHEKKQRLQVEAQMRAQTKGEEHATPAATPPATSADVKVKLESASVEASIHDRHADSSMDVFDRETSGSPLMDLNELELADEFAEANGNTQFGAQGEVDSNTLNEDSPWLN